MTLNKTVYKKGSFLREQTGISFNFILFYNYYEVLKLLNFTTVGSCDHIAMYISHQMLFQCK